MLFQCPETVIYIRNFITSEEEHHILRHVEQAPKPKWTQLSRRRLLNYGGVPHKNGMIAEAIPDWLQTYVEKINNLGVLGDRKANHVLVNEYLQGQGIMPHFDGPLFCPIISTISCGSHTVLQLHKTAESDSNAMNPDASLETKTTEPDSIQVLVERRSLLMIKDDAYQKYMHSIEERDEDVVGPNITNVELCESVYEKNERLVRGKRISLTIRHVPKTSKLKLRF